MEHNRENIPNGIKTKKMNKTNQVPTASVVRKQFLFNLKFLILIGLMNVGLAFGQNITLNTAISGTSPAYTCGSSVVSVSVTDGSDNWICFCPPAGQYAQIDINSLNLEDLGGSNPDDWLYIYEGCGTGGTLLYNPQPSAGISNVTVTATAPDVCLTIRVQERGSGTGTGGTMSLTVNCVPNCIDPTPYTSGAAGYISGVNINSGALTNTSGWNGYVDNTGTCVNVMQGDALSVAINTFGNGNPLFATAWIDWNGNGVFEASEQYIFGSSTSSTTHSINSSIPCNAAIGTITMRIATQFNSAPTPCASPTIYGDVEDYCFTISPMAIPYAGPDQVLALCASSASLSADPIAPTHTGTWSFTSGGGVLSDPNDPNATITDLEPGVNTLLWTVETPNCGDFTSSMTITTNGVPTPANAGNDFETCLNTATVTAVPVVVGTGNWSIVSGAGIITPPSSNATALITGLVIGSPLTLLWTTTNGVCTSTDQVTITMIAGVTASNAGSDQSVCSSDPVISLSGNTAVAGDGIWTGSGGTINDPSDPNTTLSTLSEGVYTYTWTISAPGCASSASSVTLTVEFCDPTIIEVTCPGPVTYTDGGGNYGNNELIVTKYCPSTPGEYISATFTQATFASPADHIIVLNGADYGASIIDDFYSLATINNGPTITSSADDGCLTFMFLSNASSVAAGWSAQISCQVTPSATNVEECSWTNCLGNCARTICGVPIEVPFTGDGVGAQELNAVNGGCLSLGETCSNWFYINPISAGTLTLDMFVNSGQDQDFALWEAYGNQLQCPTMTGNDPLLCNFAGSSAAGTGFNDAYAFASYEPTLNISQAQIDADLYYILVVNTYNPGGACPQPTVSMTFGGTAGLTCDPPILLAVELLEFGGMPGERFNKLFWKTATETDNSHFILQGSLDGQVWSNIAQVEGHGDSFEEIEYSTEDHLFSGRLTYYRLLQFDYDGESTTSQTIVVVREALINDIVSNIYPNPSNTNFHFNYGGSDYQSEIKVEVTNSLGQVVSIQEYSKFNKYVALTIDASGLSEGLYQVRISQGDKSETQKISVIR